MLKFKEYTEEEILQAVGKNGYDLQFVKNQTEEICLVAVKENGYALGFVKEQNEKICLEAVKEDGCAFRYVKNQTEDICLEAVKENGLALQFVETFYPSLLRLESEYMDEYKEYFKDEINKFKKEITIKEIEEKLGYEIKIIKENK